MAHSEPRTECNAPTGGVRADVHGLGEPQASACANTSPAPDRSAALAELRRAIEIGCGVGLEVHGGHGLTYRNIGPVAALPGFGEFNIGHSIVARSVFVGMRSAVREMKDLITRHAPT